VVNAWVINELRYSAMILCEKSFEIVAKKFGGKEKSRTFALPLKNGRLIRLRVLRKTGAEE
jgi:hypothetical protein